MRKTCLSAFLVVLFAGHSPLAQKRDIPAPDIANVKYGVHDRNVMDVCFSDTTKVTPLALYIHGGGFVSGSKERINALELKELLESGIAVASINYRFLGDAPLPAAHRDALRALQFIRSNATDWKIDKDKIAAFGGSAGAQLSMWLAFSDDMANPDAEDPVERESSRLSCVASRGGQTTMDIGWWKEWIPGFNKLHYTREQLYGMMTDEEIGQAVEDISALSIITSDDPPIFMRYGMPPDEAIPSDPKRVRGWQIHHVMFGIKLQEKMKAIGVEAHLQYPGTEGVFPSKVDFLKAKLLD